MGGESYFVDAYHAAARLQKQDPERWEVLATELVAFEYRNGGHWRHWERPTFELNGNRQIRAVNYSPPFQAPMLLFKDVRQPIRLHHLRTALQAFDEQVDHGDMRYTVRLAPGDCVAFDNRRVLHARTAFDWRSADASEPGRWLKGCYVEGDSVADRFRMLSSAGD